MKLSFSFCVFIFLCLFHLDGTAQNLPVDFCDTSTYRAVQRLKGDMVKVTCDTVYFLNKKTFHLLLDSYAEYHQQTEDLSGIFNLTDAYLQAYKKRVDEQRKEYDSLTHYFDSLAAHSNKMAEHTQSQLQEVSSNLDTINIALGVARGNIGEAKNIIKQQQRRLWLTKLFWGAGGVAVGLWVATLLIK